MSHTGRSVDKWFTACKSATTESRRVRVLAAVECIAASVHSNWVSVDQAACKPGSVHGLATDRRPFLWDGPCGPPHATNPDGARRRACHLRDAHPYSVLLQAGLALPSLSPGTRCALTAPFHPYRGMNPEAVCFLWRYPSSCLGRTLSAALPTWSPDFPPAVAHQRSPGRPIDETE